MNDTTVVITNTGAVSGTITVGSIPNNMIYWTAGSHTIPWANVAATTNTWEMEVNFYD